MHSVKLNIGTNTFKGEGATPQAARHDAASKALKVLKEMKEEDTCDEADGPEEGILFFFIFLVLCSKCIDTFVLIR